MPRDDRLAWWWLWFAVLGSVHVTVDDDFTVAVGLVLGPPVVWHLVRVLGAAPVRRWLAGLTLALSLAVWVCMALALVEPDVFDVAQFLVPVAIAAFAWLWDAPAWRRLAVQWTALVVLSLVVLGLGAADAPNAVEVPLALAAVVVEIYMLIKMRLVYRRSLAAPVPTTR